MIVRKIGFFQILGAILFCITAIFLWSFFLGEYGLWNKHKLSVQIRHLEQEKDSLQTVLLSRHREGEQILRDTFYIESIARTKFGMAKGNEAVYQFVDE